jgi:thioesterase domain-containing protein
VRQVQPEGPYALGGRCFGGTIAFEMAQQLSREGQQVALLALFGSAPPTHKRGAGQHLARRMAYHRRQGRLLNVLLGYLPIKAAKVRRRLDWQAKKLANRVAGRPTPGSGSKPKYIPRIYAGRLTVFQTSEALREAWAELAAEGVEYHVIGGSHHDMFREPLVGDLAARLRTHLDHAEEAVTVQ